MSLSSVAAGELGQQIDAALGRNHVPASKVAHEVQFAKKRSINPFTSWLNHQPKGDQVSSPALQLSLVLVSLVWY